MMGCLKTKKIEIENIFEEEESRGAMGFFCQIGDMAKCYLCYSFNPKFTLFLIYKYFLH